MATSKVVFFVAAVLGFLRPAIGALNRFSRVDSDVYRGSFIQDESDANALKALDVRTVIDLRNTDDGAEIQLLERAGIGYLSLPIGGIFFDHPDHENVKKAVEALNTPAMRPIYVHCTHGRDRTGLVISLYRMSRTRALLRQKSETWTSTQALAEYHQFGFRELPWFVGLVDEFEEAIVSHDFGL